MKKRQKKCTEDWGFKGVTDVKNGLKVKKKRKGKEKEEEEEKKKKKLEKK